MIQERVNKAGKIMEHHVKPLGDRVLVEPIEEPEVTPTGIAIPETAREVPTEGVVIELGTGRTDKEGRKLPFEIKPGDHVLLKKYGGTEVELEDKVFKMVQADDILAVLVEPRG
jgi:chaperonin GroES